MTGRNQGGWMVVAMIAALIAQAAAQSPAQQAAKPAGPQEPAQTVAAKRVIVVSLEDHKLALVEDGKVVKVYTVAVGKPSTPSPVGTFSIQRRVVNPTYSHNGIVVPPGPNNPVGTRWMGLSIPGYGIHGTNVPNSIGKAASHGCIRMAKADLEELYPMVQVGDTVEIVGQRSEETARLFGGETNPAAAQPATQVAVASAASAQQAVAAAAPSATKVPSILADAVPAAAASLTLAGAL